MENGEEATCKGCGEWFPKNELTDGCCIPCFERNVESEDLGCGFKVNRKIIYRKPPERKKKKEKELEFTLVGDMVAGSLPPPPM